MYKDFIYKTIELSSKDNMFYSKHIAYATDSNYLIYVVNAIFSILEHNDNIHFHLIVREIDNIVIEKLKSFTNKNYKVSIYCIDDAIFKSFQICGHFSIGMYFRLLLPCFLKDITSKFLYLDIDTLCVNSLDSLFDHDISGFYVAAVRDNISFEHYDTVRCLGFYNNKNDYFNSGVMMINVRKWISESIWEKFVSYLEKATFIYPDQDILNILFQNKFYFYLDDIIFCIR